MSTATGMSMVVPVQDDWIRRSPAHHQLIRNFLATREGKAVAVKFSRPVSTRSRNHSSNMWGVVLTSIAEPTGHTTKEVFQAQKDLFLPRRFIRLGSREVEVAKSTTDLTIEAGEKFLTQLRAWAETELNITFSYWSSHEINDMFPSTYMRKEDVPNPVTATTARHAGERSRRRRQGAKGCLLLRQPEADGSEQGHAKQSPSVRRRLAGLVRQDIGIDDRP